MHRPRYVDRHDPGAYLDGYAGHIDRTIARTRRNTIGDAVRRSAAHDPEKDALVFGEQRWSYAELDAGANRVANALLVRGLEKGDRVAAYSVNSDAYVLLWLGCVRAGLVHVPEEHAREKLADFKRPKHIFFVEDLPRNAAGKILKRELRSRFATERGE